VRYDCNRHDNIDIDREAVRPAARANVEKSLGWIVEGWWNGEDRLSWAFEISSKGGVSQG